MSSKSCQESLAYFLTLEFSQRLLNFLRCADLCLIGFTHSQLSVTHHPLHTLIVNVLSHLITLPFFDIWLRHQPQTHACSTYIFGFFFGSHSAFLPLSPPPCQMTLQLRLVKLSKSTCNKSEENRLMTKMSGVSSLLSSG